MKDFLAAHDSKIKGVLSCFDRMLFRGYLPIQNGADMASFLNHEPCRTYPFRFLADRRRRPDAVRSRAGHRCRGCRHGSRRSRASALGRLLRGGRRSNDRVATLGLSVRRALNSTQICAGRARPASRRRRAQARSRQAPARRSSFRTRRCRARLRRRTR